MNTTFPLYDLGAGLQLDSDTNNGTIFLWLRLMTSLRRCDVIQQESGFTISVRCATSFLAEPASKAVVIVSTGHPGREILGAISKMTRGWLKRIKSSRCCKPLHAWRPKVALKNDRYTYRVTWSKEDGEYVGLCAEFPSLSWLASTPEAALRGIRKVVA
jgi:hypothetical protein